MADAWTSLRETLDEREKNARPTYFWWRDDDATRITSALTEMVGMSEAYKIPITLAVIPCSAEAELAHWLADQATVSVAQHGMAHQNNAIEGARAVELGGGLSDDAVLMKLDQARGELRSLFGENMSSMLVPPWNRIRESLIGRLPRFGITQLSRFHTHPERPKADITYIDAHVDIINWRRTRAFVGDEKAIGEFRNALSYHGSRKSPIGLLTHHLDHDAGCWRFLERLFGVLKDYPSVHWVDGTRVA